MMSPRIVTDLAPCAITETRNNLVAADATHSESATQQAAYKGDFIAHTANTPPHQALEQIIKALGKLAAGQQETAREISHLRTALDRANRQATIGRAAAIALLAIIYRDRLATLTPLLLAAARNGAQYGGKAFAAAKPIVEELCLPHALAELAGVALKTVARMRCNSKFGITTASFLGQHAALASMAVASTAQRPLLERMVTTPVSYGFLAANHYGAKVARKYVAHTLFGEACFEHT